MSQSHKTCMIGSRMKSFIWDQSEPKPWSMKEFERPEFFPPWISFWFRNQVDGERWGKMKMYKLLWLHLCVEYISICNQFIDECHLVGDINLKGFNFSLTVFYVMLNSFFFFFVLDSGPLHGVIPPALGYLNNLVSVSESRYVQYFPSHTIVKGSSSFHLLLEV